MRVILPPVLFVIISLSLALKDGFHRSEMLDQIDADYPYVLELKKSLRQAAGGQSSASTIFNFPVEDKFLTLLTTPV